MPRTEARLKASMWTDDDDWRALHPDGKNLYQMLLAQPELRHCGVITINLRLWARRIGWDQETLAAALKYTCAARFTIADEDTGELLIRTLIRNDEVWKQPKVLAIAIADAARVESATLRAVIFRELGRLPLKELTNKTREPVIALLDALPARLAHALPQGPADPPPQGHAEGVADHRAERPADAPADLRVLPGAQGARGKGRNNGGSLRKPLAPGPNPPAPGASWAQSPMVPFGLPGAQTGEGGLVQETPSDGEVSALVGTIRTIRPDWSERSIRESLCHRDTLDRPWPLIRAAALIRAADERSHSPGGLHADGYWWAAARDRTAPPPRPKVTCPDHHVSHAAGSECPSCAADRKAAVS
jgi:hypothetical protein